MVAFQQSAALKAAIELDLFTRIAQGHQTPAALATACDASERGLRILADYWTAHGLLAKRDGRYELLPEAAAFLDRQSPAYLGALTGFLDAPHSRRQFDALTESVRRGGVSVASLASTAPNYEGWVDFAQSMAALMRGPAREIADLVVTTPPVPVDVLDVAASHGVFGFTIALANPLARVTALDWPNILPITMANARQCGVAERVQAIAGDAFSVDLRGPYDLVILANLLHHFDFEANVRLLRRLRAVLKPGGRVVTLEFIPNPDRVSPPVPAGFSLVMLATTPAGEAYTFDEFSSMFAQAGFSGSRLVPLRTSAEALVVSNA